MVRIFECEYDNQIDPLQTFNHDLDQMYTFSCLIGLLRISR